MMDRVYSKKQLELMQKWRQGELKRINLLEGSVRSGKTWISLVLWAMWVGTMPQDEAYLMVAKTLTSLRRNVLDLLVQLVGSRNFSYSLSKKEGVLFGRVIYLEGVNDARAESKIRGMTLQGAYCDELTLFTEDFFAMLLSRLSLDGAKVFATTNPDSPRHWVMEKYISRQNEINILVLKFLIEDNPFLPEQYIESIKQEYTGVFYNRFILGQWVVAEGLVYPQFNPLKHVTDTIPEEGFYYISIDYGTLNPCSMGLWCVKDKKAYRIKEFYHDGRKTKRQMTDEEYYIELCELAEGQTIQYIVVDPSAASFITCIRRHGRYSVRKAENAVLDGIRATGTYLSNGQLLISSNCKNCINEFQLYAWDDKAVEDKPIKENDHAMDDTRYFCYTILRREFR